MMGIYAFESTMISWREMLGQIATIFHIVRIDTEKSLSMDRGELLPGGNWTSAS